MTVIEVIREKKTEETEEREEGDGRRRKGKEMKYM